METIVQEKPPFFAPLAQHFSEEQEYGLLNRLDNDTAGLLYFAKNRDIREQYKKSQADKQLYKIYMCDVMGELAMIYPFEAARIQKTHIDAKILGEAMQGLMVEYPIMHHVQDNERMVAIKSEKDWHKGRGRENHVSTIFLPLSYDKKTNTTLCYAIIQQGIRHQIRLHAASVGYPIVGDSLYAKNNDHKYLHLWSI